jgi:hypothetical protein
MRGRVITDTTVMREQIEDPWNKFHGISKIRAPILFGAAVEWNDLHRGYWLR